MNEWTATGSVDETGEYSCTTCSDWVIVTTLEIESLSELTRSVVQRWSTQHILDWNLFNFAFSCRVLSVGKADSDWSITSVDIL